MPDIEGVDVLFTYVKKIHSCEHMYTNTCIREHMDTHTYECVYPCKCTHTLTPAEPMPDVCPV